MKVLYVCGSFRFASKMNELKKKLREADIEFRMSKKTGSRGILGCLERIDEADVVYVVNPDGYVGRSVCVDVGYAYAKNKSIYVMYPIGDPPVMNMLKGVLSFQELINFLKHSGPSENEQKLI